MAKKGERPGYLKSKPGYHYWVPQRAVSDAPESLEKVKLAWPLPDHEINRLCKLYTDQLRAELDNQKNKVIYDGTFGSLIKAYRTNEFSPYHALKSTTKAKDYNPVLDYLEKAIGGQIVARRVGSDFTKWFDQIKEKKSHHFAHSCMRKLRTALGYGVTEKYHGCLEARTIMENLRFPTPPRRNSSMTFEQAEAIVLKALEMGWNSIALTQALQWDTALRRIDIIGQWVPIRKDEEGGIIVGAHRWIGPTVDVLSPDRVITIDATSKTKAAASYDLSVCTLSSMVLDRVALNNVGPLIIREDTNLPWRDNYYAQHWREIAQAAGVPNDVWSMDTRAGAISEAEAAVDLDSARRLATHTTDKMTLRYVRNTGLKKNRETAIAREAARKNKPKT